MVGKCQKPYYTSHTRKKGSKSHKATLEDWFFEEKQPQHYIHMPNALPGQHFHCDFGFMRSKSYQEKDSDREIQTSVDGKSAYLVIVDRATRYMWVYSSSTKQPPLEFCKNILHKSKASVKHRTVCCNQGELATSKRFKEMLKEEGFNLEVTGSNSSKQNGIAERPHQTLARMVQCILHSSNLGLEYWPYTLIHSVYIKNRLPYQSINKSPYDAITGKQPDLQDYKSLASG